MSRRPRAWKLFAPAIFTRNDSSEIDRLTGGIDAGLVFSGAEPPPGDTFFALRVKSNWTRPLDRFM